MLGVVACRGNVEHPGRGEANGIEHCANRKPEENNCLACSSRPECGWCSSPQPGMAECQPEARHERGVGRDSTPASCQAGWAMSSEQCEAPPPPPPLPARKAEGAP
jgi:hypothetical protein